MDKQVAWLKAVKKEHIVLLVINLALIAVFGSLFRFRRERSPWNW